MTRLGSRRTGTGQFPIEPADGYCDGYRRFGHVAVLTMGRPIEEDPIACAHVGAAAAWLRNPAQWILRPTMLEVRAAVALWRSVREWGVVIVVALVAALRDSNLCRANVFHSVKFNGTHVRSG